MFAEPLGQIRVLDFSTGIAGGYASKLFADAGADVIKVEAGVGDPMRRWSATGSATSHRDSALFRYMHTSQRAVTGTPSDEGIQRLVADADLVIDSYAPGAFDEELSTVRHGSLVRLSLTPFGRGGPYQDRPATEFTVQAECGSGLRRGLATGVPYYAPGRIAEFVAGVFGAVGALAAVRRAQIAGIGEHVDTSWFEAMALTANVHLEIAHHLAGQPEITVPARCLQFELPSIEPTADGWVGFTTHTRSQFNNFLTLIERPDLIGREELADRRVRQREEVELKQIFRRYTQAHTTAEIVDAAAALRIPVAPVNSGRTVLDNAHLRQRGSFVTSAEGDFEFPRLPLILNGSAIVPRGPAPRLGQDDGSVVARIRPPVGAEPAARDRGLPLEGLRILDCTTWWAGPTSTYLLAALGADVVHIESLSHLDGGRTSGTQYAPAGEPWWWEFGSAFLGCNTNKRSLGLNLDTPRGIEVMHRLIRGADGLIENFSPRVFDRFGLGWEAVHELNRQLIMVRMPAFGLDGPWRDYVGFAQTMDQFTGLAWLTSFPEDQPRIQQGPCDPFAGAHAAFGFLMALAQRDHTGEGSSVEVPMVEGALNAAVEQIVEWSCYGKEMQRNGNRSPYAAPQGLYRCQGWEQWLAISCETDEQWRGLRKALGDPEWSRDPILEEFRARQSQEDIIDAHLSDWAEHRQLQECVELLLNHGVPAAAAQDPRTYDRHPQMVARGFHETLTRSVGGTLPMYRPPFTYASVRKWIRTPAPLLGEHNRSILSEAGFDDGEIEDLEVSGVLCSSVQSNGDRL